MANTGIDGDLVLLNTNNPLLGGVTVGLDGFIVEIHERGLFGKKFLASAITDAAGNYSVRYPPSIFDRRLMLEMYDNVHRLIFEMDLGTVTDPIHVVGTILKMAFNAHGWVVTMDELAGATWLSTGNQTTLLIDNAAAWSTLTDEVTAAAETVHVSQLQFDLSYMFTKFVPDPPNIGTPTDGTKLEVELKLTASGGTEVHLLMNDFYIGMGADSWRKVKKYFAGSSVQVRGFQRIPIEGAMHAKIATIDGSAGYTIGSGLLQEYFDGAAHLIDDPRRGEMTFPKNQMKVPIHDLSAKLTGPVVQDLESVFQLLWSDLATMSVPPRVAAGDGDPVQLAMTIPADAVPGHPDGMTGILEGYQRAIRYAQDLVYIENQYFTDDAIVEALVRALQLKPALQVIMLLNPKVDLPFYGRSRFFPWIKWQDSAIERLLSLPAAQSSRVGFFSLWSHEMPAAGSRIIRSYVHSKLAIVDDKWATVGSANLDGVSLSTSPYAPLYLLSPAIQIIFKKTDIKRMRAIEANAIFYNGVAGQPASDVPDRMRRALWAEHLGYPSPNHPDLTTRPAGGWLSLWNNVAARKKSALNSMPPKADPARILLGPFHVPDTGRKPGMTDEETYLFRCGIDPRHHLVETEIRSFDFRTGNWI